MSSTMNISVAAAESPDDYGFIHLDDLYDNKLISAVASFGDRPPGAANALHLPLIRTIPFDACSPLTNKVKGALALAMRGNCSFTTKARALQHAGAAAMIIINTDNTAFPMGLNTTEVPPLPTIPSAMITYDDGMYIITHLPLNATFYLYERPTVDGSIAIMWFIATGTVIASAYWAASRERQIAYSPHLPPPPPPHADEIAYVNERGAYAFVFVASAGLLLMFYFLNSLIYLLIVLFSIGGLQGMTTVGISALENLCPKVTRPYVVLGGCGRVSISSMVLFGCCCGLVIWWAIQRNTAHAYLVQNLMSIALLMMLQKTVRLPNIKVSTILLVLAFLYDIFWVFLSGYFFSKSVMITVATGGDTGESIPMLIKLPRLNDELGGYSLLGLGDIALPGLLVSFLLRFDYSKRLPLCSGYFLPSVIGYGVGVLITDLVLILTHHGQPALLYLVPCTLGITVILACTRGHLSSLWNGDHEEQTRGGEAAEDGVANNDGNLQHGTDSGDEESGTANGQAARVDQPLIPQSSISSSQ